MKLRYLFIFCLLTIGCGGGGGGSDAFVGAARVSMTIAPSTIDSHDRARVTIEIENVIDTGIILKIRYSDKLLYADNTAKLFLEGDTDGKQLTPAFNGADGNKTYLVFFLARSQFGDVSSNGSSEDPSTPATLTFELIGQSKLVDGTVEVDPDVNDPTIPDSTEFDVNNPQFEAEADAGLSVQ